jgi:hypothetical protein
MKRDYEHVHINCSNCNDNGIDGYFQFYQQEDDYVILKCNKCDNKIMFDDVRVSYLSFIDWCVDNKWDKHKELIKEYYEELLNE